MCVCVGGVLLMTDVPHAMNHLIYRASPSLPPLTFKLLCDNSSAATTAAGKQLPIPTTHCQVEQQQ